jgi:hypothetical protein
MPLSEDQRALLRLLLDGDDYDGVASLLGTEADDVRGRAGEAVAELERSGEDPELAKTVRQRLGQIEGDPGSAPVPAHPHAPVDDRRGLPRFAWVTIAGALAALAVAFAVVFLGGDSDEAATTTSADQEDVIEVKLEPVGGSGASGTAAIVRVADRPAIDVDISGLSPTGPGESYVLWLLGSGEKGLPIAFRTVGKDGRFVGRTQVPSAAAGLLPNIDVIDLSLARRDEVTPAINQAAENNTLPTHLGSSVVRGRLPG